MKRDLDLDRLILLAVEAHDHDNDPEIDLGGFEGHSDRQVSYQVMLLDEGGYLQADRVPDTEHGDRMWYLPQRLTEKGHEHLQLIRAPDIWQRTRAATKEAIKAGGHYTLQLVGELARGFIRQKARELGGFDI